MPGAAASCCSHLADRVVFRGLHSGRLTPYWGRGRPELEGGVGVGGGRAVWDPKDCVSKWPDQMFPIVNFVFPTMVTLVWGGEEWGLHGGHNGSGLLHRN